MVNMSFMWWSKLVLKFLSLIIMNSVENITKKLEKEIKIFRGLYINIIILPGIIIALQNNHPDAFI